MAIKTLKAVVIPTPIKPKKDPKTSDVDEVEQDVYREDIKEYAKARRRANENMKKMFNAVMGQCTLAMEAKLKELPKWDSMEIAMDVIELLKDMRSLCYDVQSQRHPAISAIMCLKRYLGLRQDATMSNDTYYKEFINQQTVLEHAGIKTTVTPAMKTQALEVLLYDAKTTDVDELKAAEELALETHRAMVFLQNTDNMRYSGLKLELQNNFARGMNQYPANLAGALAQINQWQVADPEKHCSTTKWSCRRIHGRWRMVPNDHRRRCESRKWCRTYCR